MGDSSVSRPVARRRPARQVAAHRHVDEAEAADRIGRRSSRAAVIDGTIASSSGSATLAPRPRRNVRRGSAFLVMIIATSSSETACSSTTPRTIDEKR